MLRIVPLFLLAACVHQVRLYDGPSRPRAEVAHITDRGSRVHLVEVNGEILIEEDEYPKSAMQAEVLPGAHWGTVKLVTAWKYETSAGRVVGVVAAETAWFLAHVVTLQSRYSSLNLRTHKRVPAVVERFSFRVHARAGHSYRFHMGDVPRPDTELPADRERAYQACWYYVGAAVLHDNTSIAIYLCDETARRASQAARE